MKNKTGFCYFDSHQRSGNFNFKRHRSMVLGLLICSLGITSIDTFAQPLAKDKDKFLGCGTSSYIYRNLDQYWNQITPGNDGKWGSVEAVKDHYNWTNLDKIYNYAINKNFLFKEHTLVWGNQQPYWIESLDSASQRAQVEEWIRLVGERYLDMALVDVVNEPFNGPPSYKKALGGDGTTGWDWVITAFQWARQYCAPGVKLLLNEYNILHSNTITNNYLQLIDTLMVRGLIDGIGVQGHYFEFRSHVDATNNVYIHDINTIKSNLNRLATTGLPIYITEFDIDEVDDSNQLEQYQIYFPIFWSHPAVKGITLWGYIQDDVWIDHPDTYLLLFDGTERPALQWIRTYIASPLPPVLISPVAVVGVPRNPLLVWHSSESATSYHIQVATNSIFVSVVSDTTVTDTLLQLNPLEANKRFYWRVSGINQHGAGEYSVTASFMTNDQITVIDELEGIPTAFKLHQNYPNPFNPITNISYFIPQKAHVSLSIYNMSGQIVRSLVNQNQNAGTQSVEWDGRDDANRQVASGIYFYKVEAGGFVQTKKMLLMK